MPYLNYYSPVEPKVWIRKILLPDRASDEEQEFRRYFQRRTVPMAQIAIVIGIVVVFLVCVLDWFLMPREFAVQVISLRAATMLSVLAVVFAWSVLRPMDPRLPYLVTAAGAIVGTTTVIVGAIATKSGTPFVAWGTIFTTFFIYLILGLRFRQASIAGWPLFVTYVALGMKFGAPIEKMAYGTLFLLFTNLIGMYAAFLFELDARELFHKKKLLRDLARTDGLTGVDNRRSFDEHLDDVWKQARRERQAVAVVLVDIDFFKLFNDCYGHRPGDHVIQAVAQCLAGSVNRPLDQVARYGGEEFAIVLYDPNEQFVRDYADELVARVADLEIEHKASDAAEFVTVSVGAAIAWPHEAERPGQLVRGADDALYESKAQGRNRSTVYHVDKPLRVTTSLNAIAL